MDIDKILRFAKVFDVGNAVTIRQHIDEAKGYDHETELGRSRLNDTMRVILQAGSPSDIVQFAATVPGINNENKAELFNAVKKSKDPKAMFEWLYEFDDSWPKNKQSQEFIYNIIGKSPQYLYKLAMEIPGVDIEKVGMMLMKIRNKAIRDGDKSLARTCEFAANKTNRVQQGHDAPKWMSAYHKKYPGDETDEAFEHQEKIKELFDEENVPVQNDTSIMVPADEGEEEVEPKSMGIVSSLLSKLEKLS